MKEELIIKLNDINDVFNPFDDNDITDELASYIENRCSRIKKKMVIKIITNEEVGEKEKAKIINAIRTHYGLETKYSMLDNKRTNQVNLVLFIVGIMIILVENLLNIFDSLINVIDILGGFIVWESANNLLFTDSEMDRKIDRSQKISNSKRRVNKIIP